MKIAIHSRAFEASKQPFIEQIFNELYQRNITLILSEDLQKYLSISKINIPFQGVFRRSLKAGDADLMLSLGGDGTFLESVMLARDSGIPILGINLGRLGFLATLNTGHLKEGLDAVVHGNFTVEERTLIQLHSDRAIFGKNNFGLNEFTITKRDIASMIVVHTYLNGEYLNSYWADGLIVSTPTGSTGYCLSAGGPVVMPHSRNFVIAPISPHNLNVRPLVVSDDSVITFETEGRSDTFLVSLDSRSRIVTSDIQLEVRKCNFKTKMIRLPNENFLKTLRLKVNWGLDSRN